MMPQSPQIKTEEPKETDAPTRNPSSELVWKRKGNWGVFYDRGNAATIPTHINMNRNNMRTAITATLRYVLESNYSLDRNKVNDLSL